MASEIVLKDLQVMATTMARSGLFGKKPDEFLSLMLLAQAQGQHPATVAMEYDIIQGRPALNSRSALSRFQLAGGKIQWLDRSDVVASAKFYHDAGGELTITWTMDRAKQAGLTGKDNWRKYPAQMLSARVIAEGVRAVYPACLSGFYTSEEVQDFVPDLGAQRIPEQKKPEPVETAVELVEPQDEDVRVAMPDPLESRIEKMLAYMDAAGIEDSALLKFLGKESLKFIDDEDIEKLSGLVRECTKLAMSAGENVNAVLKRQFYSEEVQA